MRILIKRMLVISNRQDYFGKILWINLTVWIIAMILSLKNEFFIKTEAHLIIALCISITTCSIFTIHRRNHADFVHYIGSHAKWTKFFVLLWSSVIQNAIFLVFFFLQLMFIFKASFGVSIVTALLHFIYAIAFGALAGTVITNHTVSILCLGGYYLILFNDTRWPEMEMLRLFSPVLQLVNPGSIDIPNTLALIGVCILVFSICYIIIPITVKKVNWKSGMAFLLGLMLILGVGYKEYQYNMKIKSSNYHIMEVKDIKVFYRGISRQEAENYGKWLSYIERELSKEEVIKKPIRKIVIQRYFISPSWLPYLDAPMIPVQIKEGVMEINVFSKAMMLHANAEFRYNMLLRMVSHYLSSIGELDNAGPYILVYMGEIILDPDNLFPDDIKQYNNRVGINVQRHQ